METVLSGIFCWAIFKDFQEQIRSQCVHVLRDNFRFVSGSFFKNRRRKEQTMEDDLGRWIQEAVLSSYLEECKIFNELDASYGFDYHFSSEFPGGSFPARKRKLSPSSCEDNSFSAGKQTKNCWRRLDPAVAVLVSQKADKRSIAFTKEIPVRKKE